MRNQPSSFIGLLAAGLIILSAAAFAGAQTDVTPSRITRAIDPAILTVLRGNTHPLAKPQFDRGAAPASLPMQRMLLVLQRSAAQETALDALLEEQQDASSPNYHHWLTPQQFGQQFGPSDQDIQTITSWLESQGFQIDRVSNGRTVIEFSGTAGEVQSAFHTAIHRYAVNGENHWANSSDPEIPAALAPVVAGIDTLHNFPRTPMIHMAGLVSRSKDSGEIVPDKPLYTLSGQCGVPGLACYGLSPYDFATIYDVTPLWNASPAIDGTGQTIAIVGESDISIQDVRNFRNYFGLPANDPQIIVDGVDPGTVPGDETESDLDVEWAGAVAKGATVDLVVSASTESSLGVDLSAEYIIDNNLAGVLSESYGICELGLGTTGNQFYNQLWQQAAQGITVLVAGGDNGSAGCDDFTATPPAPAQFGLMVSGFASTPYDISMGGTDFNDLTDASTYWSATNTPPTGQPSLPPSVSARSYIPETTWNNSCTNAVFGNLLGFSTNAETNCNNGQLTNFVIPEGGSGGKSSCTSSDGQTPASCTAGYSKPSWQTALTPNDGKRDVPDVSLFAAVGSPSGAFYLICAADVTVPYTSCQTTDPNTQFAAIGGTSAATPTFAGIIAMVNQKTGSRQGNANYILYELAAQSGASCNSSNGPGANCVFHDVTNGTNAMPCASGSPNCVTQTPGDAYGVLSGYTTDTSYDQATGLGSVDADNLVKAWSSFALTLEGSSTTLTLTPPSGGSLSNLTHGQTVTFATSVSAVAPATGTPTGTVSLVANTGTDGQSVQSVTLNGSGSGSGSTNALPGGTYTVVAQYPGDGTFKSSVSAGTTVTVSPEASKVQLAYELLDPSTGAITNSNATSAIFGTPAALRVNVTSAAGDGCANNAPGSTGCPTGSIGFTIDSSSFSSPLNVLGYIEDGSTENPLLDLAGGAHAISASYAGDVNYTAPTPNPTAETVTITPAPTTLSVTPNATSDRTIVNFNATVSAANIYSRRGPGGTVTFFDDGTTSLGNAPVLGYVGGGQANGYASLSKASLHSGQNSVTAQYPGDGNYASSLSAPVSVWVPYPTNTTVSSSSSSIQYGQSVTLTANVSAVQSGGPAITGSITFLSNGMTLGTANLAGGQAQLMTTKLLVGTDQITATYSGDSYYSASTSPAIAEPVGGFTVSANPYTINISAPGQSGTTTATFVAENGFSTNGNVPLTMTCSGLPAHSTCSVSPSTINVAMNGTATATLTVVTTASATVIPGARNRGMIGHERALNWQLIAAAILLLLCCGMAFRFRGRRQRWGLALALVALSLVFANAGCGGGSGSGNAGNGNGISGTPPGAAAISVSFTINGMTQTLQLIVDVQ